MSRPLHLQALQFVGIYFVIGCLWIVLSDHVLLSIFPASADLTPLQTVKGVLYVTITSLLLFGFIQRSTKRLRHSEHFLESTINALAAHIAVIDETGRILTVNKAWNTFARFGKADLDAASTGANYLEVCDKAAQEGDREAAAVVAGIRAVLYGRQESFVFEYSCPTPHEMRWFVMQVNRFDDNGITRAVISHEEITEQKQAEQASQQAREQAEEVARVKSALLNNMSHEFRTPLTTVLGYADLMLNELEGESLEYAHYIKHGGQRLLQTLDSVLDHSMLEAGTFRLDPVVCDVGTEVEAAVDIFQSLAKEKQLTLHAELPSVPVYASLDQKAFSRILNNLIENAIKFTTKGEVRLTVKATKEEVIVEVKDTGVGIDPDFHRFLFVPFNQESTGLTRTHEGVGLGLTIVKKLVDLHHGRIKIDSEKGKGTTFFLHFPRHMPQPASAPATGKAVFSNGPARILILEDNEAMRFLLKQVLGELPEIDQIETASDAEEAVRLAQQQHFAAFILDINLRRARTGIDVLQDLRGLPEYAHTPMIALTAYALPGDQDHFLAAGFDAYLGKPFDPENLKKMLGHLLNRVR